jgi:hypothetical protein
MITKRQKAKIAIAADVIAQIKTRRYVAETGLYIGNLDIEGETGDLQKVIKKQVTRRNPCNVCALGSAFLSTVRLFDKFQLTEKTKDGDAVEYNAMRSKLQQFFTRAELGVIEASFEVSSSHLLFDSPSETSTKIYTEFESNSNIYKDFLSDLDDEERLLWIMQAVIEQDGKPTLRGFKTEMLRDLAYDKKFTDFRVRTFGS